MSSGATGGAERRAHARFEIRLPVRVTLFTSPKVDRDLTKPQARKSNEPIVIQAMALDVSERGLRLEVAGATVRKVLDSSDPLVGLEVVFMHDDLRSIGPRPGAVQWRRAGSDKDTWALGARFDSAFSAEELSRILRASTNAPKRRPGVAVAWGATALLGAFLWSRHHSIDRAEHEATMRRLSAIEDDLARMQQEMEALSSHDRTQSATALDVRPAATAGLKPSVVAPDIAEAGVPTDALDAVKSAANAGDGASGS